MDREIHIHTTPPVYAYTTGPRRRRLGLIIITLNRESTSFVSTANILYDNEPVGLVCIGRKYKNGREYEVGNKCQHIVKFLKTRNTGAGNAWGATIWGYRYTWGT